MSTPTPVVTEDDPALQANFIQEMVRQMRALDAYGTLDSSSDAQVLDPFVLTKERRREIPLVGDPDEEIVARVRCFYNAVSTLIEKECGLMATPLVHLSSEGFGRALITVGRLVVADRSLRDVHRYGFRSLGAMRDEGEKFLQAALALIREHRSVAML